MGSIFRMPRGLLAYVAVALSDAVVACWDAKSRTGRNGRSRATRPSRRSSRRRRIRATRPATPPLPARWRDAGLLLPGGGSGRAGDAAQAAASRCWAGIHFSADNDTGLTIGHTLGYLIAERIRADGVSQG